MSTQFAKKHQEMTAVAAYYRAEHRGFNEGGQVADWLEAEEEIKQMLQEDELDPLVFIADGVE